MIRTQIVIVLKLQTVAQGGYKKQMIYLSTKLKVFTTNKQTFWQEASSKLQDYLHCILISFSYRSIVNKKPNTWDKGVLAQSLEIFIK